MALEIDHRHSLCSVTYGYTMSQVGRMATTLLGDREAVLVGLGAAERYQYNIRTEVELDFDAQPYDGISDRNYPLWDTHCLEDVVFVHDVIIDDFGYELENEIQEEELPKFTSDGGIGELSYKLAFLDRFSGRLLFRGHLKGSSFEMNMDILLRLSVLAYRERGYLGFAGETLAEGYAFELEARYKQAFFCYFSAFESHVEVCREANNLTALAKDKILENDRLASKFSKLVKAQLPGTRKLNEIKFWGALVGSMAKLEGLRNAIAHNREHDPVRHKDVEEAFVLFAIAVPLLASVTADAEAVVHYYRLSLPKSKSQLRKERV